MQANINFAIRERKNFGLRKYNDVTEHEWWRFIGIIISASPHGKGGDSLWNSSNKESLKFRFDEIAASIDYGPKTAASPNALDVMLWQRFKEIREYFPKSFEDHEARDAGDAWYKIGLLVKGYNENRSQTVAAAIKKVFDESMSAWQPRTTPYGSLPNISFILRKPKPLGTEFKIVACATLGKVL